MKRFKTLEIRGADFQLVALLNRLKDAECPGFAYRKKMTENYAKNIFVKSDHAACFKTERKRLFKSSIFMLVHNGALTVTNIISMDNPSLGIDNYNRVLTAFHDEFVVPRLDEKYHVKMSDGEEAMQNILDADTFGKLVFWENLCNKENPVSHPEDFQRWIDFVVSAYQHGSVLTPEDVVRWLREDKNWPEALDEKVNEISYLYGYGIDVLKTASNENR